MTESMHQTAGAGRAIDAVSRRQAGRQQTTPDDLARTAADTQTAMAADADETADAMAASGHEIAATAEGAAAEAANTVTDAMTGRATDPDGRAAPATDDAKTAV